MPFVPLPLSVRPQIVTGCCAIGQILVAGCIPARRDAPTGTLTARNFASAAALVLGATILASAQSPPPFDLNRAGVPDSVLRQVRANPAEPV